MNQNSLELIDISLREDLGPRIGKNVGDITSIACIGIGSISSANILFKESGVVCGHEVVLRILEQIDPSLEYEIFYKDGEVVEKNTIVSRITGASRNILTAERTLLNFIQRLSAIATLTKSVVDKVEGNSVKILDTRKTTPGFRELEKYAVLTGGGTNHRMGLYDEFMIKNNHIDALGGDIKDAILKCRAFLPDAPLKVEVRNRAEIQACIDMNVRGLLIDNYSPLDLKEEVNWIRASGGGEMTLEASGGITPENVLEYASSGVDEISLGFLTHSVKALDISLRFISEK